MVISGDMEFQCETCSKSFDLKVNLQNHVRRNHRAPILTCSHCGYNTKFKNSLIKHINICVYNPNSKRRSFLGTLTRKVPVLECPLCNDFQCKDRAVMIVHYTKSHDVQIVKTRLQFEDIKAFDRWKEQTESSGSFKFVLKDLGKTRCTVTKTYRCCRDGFFKSRGRSIRRLKAQGSYKINGVCPCQLRVAISNETGAIDGSYVACHVGHEGIVVGPAKKKRPRKIANGPSQRTTIDNFRDSLINGNYSQLYHTSRKALAVKKSFRVFQVTDDRLCSDDVRSLEAWINTFGGDSGVVRFYKPQSTILAGHPELHYEDCILILANNAQINALNQFASNVICIDGTRGNNPRNFELHTLLVKDAKRQCIPCAFMVSNRIDAEIMGIFIAVIKTLLLQPIAPKVLIMSDVNYNVWVSAMPPPEYWLLCPWHVDQAWRKNLAKIGDPKKRWTAYKLLQTVMDEPDENATDLLLQNALVFMASDPDLVEYDNFFRSEYLSSIQFWAYCFRNHLDINMGAMLDSVRNIIKRFYLDGKQQKPLEKGVNDLLKFVLDKFQDDPTQENLSSEILAMRDRHARSADLEALVITREPGSDWLISSSSQTALCEVKKTANRCDCEGKCEVCAVCIHEYRCTCNDYMKSNLCKHIHRIVALSNQTNLATVAEFEVVESLRVSDNIDPQEDFIALLAAENPVADVPSTSQNLVKAKEALTEQFFTILRSANSMEALDEIKKALAPIPDILMLKSLQSDLGPFT